MEISILEIYFRIKGMEKFYISFLRINSFEVFSFRVMSIKKFWFYTHLTVLGFTFSKYWRI